jgi:hypothetical protein
MHVLLAVKGDEKDCDVDHIPKKTFGIPFWCWGKYSPKCSFLSLWGWVWSWPTSFPSISLVHHMMLYAAYGFLGCGVSSRDRLYVRVLDFLVIADMHMDEFSCMGSAV